MRFLFLLECIGNQTQFLGVQPNLILVYPFFSTVWSMQERKRMLGVLVWLLS